MSWPVPAASSSGSPAPFSWNPGPASSTSRPQLPGLAPPAWRGDARASSRKRGGNWGKEDRHESRRKLRYSVAMVGGFLAFHWAKKILKRIPVVGAVVSPVLDLFPSVVVGTAAGAAVAYGLEEGDIYAARHVVKDKAAHVQKELTAVAEDLKADWREAGRQHTELQRRLQPALEQTARTAVQTVDELERQLLPVIEREFRNVESYVDAASKPSSRNPYDPLTMTQAPK